MAALDVDLEGPITLRSLGFLRREPQWSVSNQILDSYEDARDELAIAMRVGIRGMVDCTPIGLGRRPESSRRVARELGLAIVGATGYYRQAFQPPEVADMTVDVLEERFLREVLEGMDGTDVRAGLIGELGTSGDAIRPQEERVLIAAGRVQRQTNVPVYVHTEGRPRRGPAGDRPAHGRRGGSRPASTSATSMSVRTGRTSSTGGRPWASTASGPPSPSTPRSR